MNGKLTLDLFLVDMLVYRKKHMAPIVAVPVENEAAVAEDAAASGGEVSAQSEEKPKSPYQLTPPPAYLQAEIAKNDEALIAEQNQVEMAHNQVRLVVYSPNHFEVDEDGIARQRNFDGAVDEVVEVEEEQAGSEEGKNKGEAEAGEKKTKIVKKKPETRISFSNIDRRMTVRSFKDYIRAMFPKEGLLLISHAIFFSPSNCKIILTNGCHSNIL